MIKGKQWYRKHYIENETFSNTNLTKNACLYHVLCKSNQFLLNLELVISATFILTAMIIGNTSSGISCQQIDRYFTYRFCWNVATYK